MQTVIAVNTEKIDKILSCLHRESKSEQVGEKRSINGTNFATTGYTRELMCWGLGDQIMIDADILVREIWLVEDILDFVSLSKLRKCEHYTRFLSFARSLLFFIPQRFWFATKI